MPDAHCRSGPQSVGASDRSDRTRPTGSLQLLPPLLKELNGAKDVALLFSTGLHRPLKDADKIAITGEAIFKSYPLLDHWPDRGNAGLLRPGGSSVLQ
jgi:nickel-dependent lactate racemase